MEWFLFFSNEKDHHDDKHINCRNSRYLDKSPTSASSSVK